MRLAVIFRSNHGIGDFTLISSKPVGEVLTVEFILGGITVSHSNSFPAQIRIQDGAGQVPNQQA